jgi:sugar lactone lactonase YvrE
MNGTAEVTAYGDAGGPVKSRRGRRILGLVLIVLLLLLGLGVYLLFRLMVPAGGKLLEQTDKTGLTWVRSIYGMSNAPKDQLERTQAAVAAPDGTIWVVDGAHRALIHFSADGRYLGNSKGPARAPLSAPGRFTIGTDGRFYVTDSTDNAVRVLDPAGNDVGSFGVPKPVSVAVSEDRIVVGSVAGFAITDKAGKPIKVIGTRGKGDNQFDYVHGVGIGPNGNIYIADSFNNRLSAYDPTGKRLWIVRTGPPGNSAGLDGGRLTPKATKDVALKGTNALQLPVGMTIDGAGRIVLVDYFDSSIAVFDPKNGALIAKYGEIGGEDGQFFYPTSISYDPQTDQFAIADSMNARAQIVRIPGSGSGNGALAMVRRALAGPLRACLFPLAVILLAFLGWLVSRALRRRRARDAAIAQEAGLT